MSLEQNSPRTSDKRPESWNPDNTLNAETRVPAPEHRDDKDKKGMGLKAKVGLVLAGLGIAGGGVAVGAMGGGENAPAERSPAASATPNPGEGAVEQIVTPEQQLRDSMVYGTEYEYFVDPRYYAEVSANGGIDGAVEESYINRDYVEQVVQNLLNNKAVALETADEDAILATYTQVSPGEFGEMDGSVASLREQAKLKSEQIEKDPSFPVGSYSLTSVADISPNPTDKNVVDLLITFDHVDYGINVNGDVTEYHTVEDYEWTIERTEVTGWSDGGSRSNWGISRESLVSTDTVSE